MYIYYKNEWIKVDQNDEQVKELNIKIGAGAVIGTNAVIHAGAVIGAGADIGAGAVIGTNAVINADVIIHAGAVIGERADIGAGAVIGERAVIGAGADIDVIISKYNCNRYFNEKTKTDYIRIGCKIHALQEWSNVEFQEKLAYENDRRWWEAKGRKILNFLMEG